MKTYHLVDHDVPSYKVTIDDNDIVKIYDFIDYDEYDDDEIKVYTGIYIC